MDHGFVGQPLLESAAGRPRRLAKGQVALVLAAMLAAALAVTTVPDPHPAATALIAATA